MLTLKELFDLTVLEAKHGKALVNMVILKLSDGHNAQLDFEGIDEVSDDFFYELIVPLVREFGKNSVKERLEIKNLIDDINLVFLGIINNTNTYNLNYKTVTNRTSSDIAHITFIYLMAVREILKTQPETARYFFGIEKSMAETLLSLNITSIQMMANSGVICFQPRFSNEFADRLSAMNAEEIDFLLHISGNIQEIYGN